MKKLLLALASLAMFAGCNQSADVVSKNLSVAADNFEVERRIVFYNGITGEYMLTIEGLCALGNHDAARELTVTCQTGSSTYKKHFLGLSDNVTYFVEQVEPAASSKYHYSVTFKPSVIVPDIHIR
jgi:opacity protein-like surface antigen